MKKIVGIFAILFMSLGVFGCGNVNTVNVTAWLYFNPTVAMTLNQDDEIVSVFPANEDALVILIELELIGLSLEEAIDLYIEEAIELGYVIDAQTTQFQVEIEGVTQGARTRVKDKLQLAIENSFLNRERSVNVTVKEYDDSDISAAEALGIAVRTYKRIQERRGTNNPLSENDVNPSVIRSIIRERNGWGNDWLSYRDQLRADVGSEIQDIKDEYLRQIIDLRHAINEAEDSTSLEEELITLFTEMKEAIKEVTGEHQREHDHIGQFQ